MTSEVGSSEWTAIGSVVERLSARYAGVPTDEVTAIVHRHHATFGDSTVRDYVPLFVERRAARDLDEVARPAR